ncbi:MAG TPA: ABC transporter permease [Thermoanaerobaculia bacterium]|jgi:ABC-type transport system involved in multi-copper enzyme maturation permease subunit|nr:ABC transporter permease [Thermoanaerobaculia bacterium]
MKSALVIAARELEEKRFVAYAAVAFAILPFILGLIPAIGGKSPSDAIALGSLTFATGFAVALAVLTGAGFVGRDLSDGRMSFYFSRPVASASIWFGKLTAGILMIVGCFGVIVAPAWLAAGRYWKTFWTLTLGEMSVNVLVCALALFLIAHVIGTFARSRSPLIVADFAAAVLCGVTIRFLVLPLAAGRASMLVTWLGIFLSAALAVAIVGGGAWQLKRGRTDRRRNHRALSQFLWGTMAVALLIAAGCVAWVISAKPSDLTTMVYASRGAGSPFLVLTGRARYRGDYNATYLIDVGDNSARTIDLDSWGLGGVRFTRDGRSVVVPRREKDSADLVIYKRGASNPVETGLTLPATYYPIFVSDDGNRIATIVNGNLSIYDVPQKRSLVSVRVPSDWRSFYQGYFVSPELFRFYVQKEDGLSIYELDTRVRGLRDTGAIADRGFVFFMLDPTVSRMIVQRHNLEGITLNDARSGAVIKTIASENIRNFCFLRDGRMAIVEGPPSKMTLHILSSDGALQRDIPFDGGGRVGFVGDDGTRVVLSVANKESSLRRLVAINLDRGVIERDASLPKDWTMINWENRPPIEPLREVVYGDGAGHIVAWNPVTGARRMVMGG